MKKTLILFTDIFKQGGIQKYNMHLCSALEKGFDDHKFIAISLTDSNNDVTKTWNNISLECCGHITAAFFRRILFFVKAIVVFLRERPSSIICSHINLSGIALFLSKVFGSSYSLFAYGIDVFDLKSGIRYQALKGADAVIAISRYTKSRMVDNGIRKDKIRILANPVDTSLFFPKDINQALLNKLDLSGKRILLTVSRIDIHEQYKGHDIILDALQMLDDNFIWLVVGSGNRLPQLQARVKDLRLSARVRITGRVSDKELIDYYNLCDLFIMPSEKEGFGFVFLEALACGKPVIAGNRDGSREPLMDGKLGFLVNPDNADKIAGTIRSVFKDQEDRTNPKYLREMVKENFGLEVFNRKVKELFNTILQ